MDKLLTTLDSEESKILERPAVTPFEPPPIAEIGDYVVGDEIARGAMGVVYSARQKSLSRTVALKVIRPSLVSGPSDIERFQSEARIAGALDHPNIVPIYEVGEEDGHHFFSMRLIEGGTLRDRRDEFADDPKHAAQLLVKISHAVQAAHQHGVLHRDLKPGNILIDEAGEPHVTDFGIARNLDAASDLTQTGQIIGTPNYMAPEQARQEANLTTAADVYGLGAILYQLLTGKPPHKGETSLEVLKAISETEPDPPRSIVHSLDRDLETIVMKCLERKPEDRYSTAAELAKELERWLDGLPIQARPIRPHERLAKWIRRKPVHAGFAMTAALLLLTFAIGGPLVGLNQARLKSKAEKELYYAEMNLASQALLSRNGFPAIRGRLDSALPSPSENPPWEWRFLDAVSRNVPQRFPHGFPTGLGTICDWSPCGEYIAIAGRSKAIRIFNPEGNLIEEIPVSQDKKKISFNRDGSRLAVVTSDRIKFLASDGWEVLGEAKTDRQPNPVIAWNPIHTNLIAIGGENGALEIWHFDSESRNSITCRSRIPTGNSIQGLCWSPDGEKVAAGTQDGDLRIFDRKSGSEISETSRERTFISALDWAETPEGELISFGGSERRLVTLRPKSLPVVANSEIHTGQVRDIEFSPDGNWLASCSEDFSLNMYYPTKRGVKQSFFGHEAIVASISWNPEGDKIASTGTDGWVAIHKIKKSRPGPIWSAANERISLSFCFSSNPDELVLNRRSQIIFKQLGSEKERILETQIDGKEILDTSASPVHPNLLVSSRDALYILDSQNGDVVTKFSNFGGASQLEWTADGSRFSYLDDSKQLIVVNPFRDSKQRLESSITRILDYSWSPDGESIAIVFNSDLPMLIVDSHTFEVKHEISHDERIYRGGWSHDGSVIAFGTMRKVSIYDLESRSVSQQFPVEAKVQSLHWSPDGNRLLVELPNPIPPQIWDPVAGRKMIDLPMWDCRVRQVSWSPDGEKIVIMEQSYLRVFDASPED
ncbi:MAG: protein kinase [Verrucomicrobiota bacterium]